MSRAAPYAPADQLGAPTNPELERLSALDPVFVALQGSGFGLLVAPLELVHQPAHMIAMVLDAEPPLDHFRNAAGEPEPRRARKSG